jgi:hypothetical protein
LVFPAALRVEPPKTQKAPRMEKRGKMNFIGVILPPHRQFLKRLEQVEAV